MRDFSITVDVAAQPHRVWQVMSDVERWREWTPSVSSIKRMPDGPVDVGTRLWIKQPKFPPAMWKVIDVKPNRGFTSVSGGPGFQVVAHHSIEPTDAGSRVTLSLRFNGWLGGWFGRMTAGINNRYLAMEANGLKTRSESAA